MLTPLVWRSSRCGDNDNASTPDGTDHDQASVGLLWLWPVLTSAARSPAHPSSRDEGALRRFCRTRVFLCIWVRDLGCEAHVYVRHLDSRL